MTSFGNTYGVTTRIARVFNTYGPRIDPGDGRIVANFVVQALRNQPLTVYGDGTHTRSFQYVDDLIEGLVRLMESDYSGPMNIGNPTEYTVIQFAWLIQKLTHTDSPIVFETLPGDDPRRRRPDISLAKAVLGWEPRVPVVVGLERTIAYFRDELTNDRSARHKAKLMLSQMAS
jgi:nucleoside-diphosphate-sugar epimerase